MGIETVLFKSEEKKSAKEIAEILHQIADKIESGSMTLIQSGKKAVQKSSSKYLGLIS